VAQPKPASTQQKKPAATQAKKSTTVQAKAPVGSQASMQRGNEVYTQVCAACHQKNGGGVRGLNPPLIKTEYVLGDKTRLINIILKGLNQPIEIDDEEYTNAMPPQPQLTDQQIADVLTFVRNSFSNKASAVTPAEVKAVRAKST
jgi:mono/diheme cytochrome c family protein